MFFRRHAPTTSASDLHLKDYAEFDSVSRRALFKQWNLVMVNDLQTLISKKLLVHLCLADNRILLYDKHKKLLEDHCFEVIPSFPHNLHDFVHGLNIVKIGDAQKCVYFMMPNDAFAHDLAQNLERHCTAILEESLRRIGEASSSDHTVSSEIVDSYGELYCSTAEAFVVGLKQSLYDTSSAPKANENENSTNNGWTKVLADETVAEHCATVVPPRKALKPPVTKTQSRSCEEQLPAPEKPGLQQDPETVIADREANQKFNHGSRWSENDAVRRMSSEIVRPLPTPAPRPSKQRSKSHLDLENQVVISSSLDITASESKCDNFARISTVPSPPPKPLRTMAHRTPSEFEYQKTPIIHALPASSSNGNTIPTIPYFGSTLSVRQTEILRQQPSGTFVVRDKKSGHNGYTIILVFESTLYKLSVQHSDRGTYFMEEADKDFASLGELVSFYREHKMTVFNPLTTTNHEVILGDPCPHDFAANEEVYAQYHLRSGDL